MTQETSVQNLENEFIKLYKLLSEMFQTTVEGGKSAAELIKRINQSSSEIDSLIDSISSTLPKNVSLNSILDSIKSTSISIPDFRAEVDQVTDKIYNEKRDNFSKICLITDDFFVCFSCFSGNQELSKKPSFCHHVKNTTMKTGILASLIAAWLLNNGQHPVVCRRLVLGSDDEVLMPLFDNNDVSIAVSASHDHSRSSASKSSKKSRTSKYSRKSSRTAQVDYGLKSHLKMNLDLPSIQSRSGFSSQQSQQSLKEFENFPLSLPSFQSNLTEDSKLTVKNVQEKVDFNIPFDIITPEDIEVVVVKQVKAQVSKNTVAAPGTIITARKATVQPGTVIVSKAQPGVVLTGKAATVSPGTIVGIADSARNPSVISTFAEIPFSSSSDDCNYPKFDSKPSENKQPTNSNLNRPDTFAGKHKRIHALEEYTIYSLKHDNDYAGPKIDLMINITVEYVSSVLIPYFKSGKILDRKSAYSIFFRAYQEFLEEENVHDVELEDDENILIFGDIHGQFPDFIKVIEKEGLPTKKLKYLFNGDIVDRGAYSVECLMTLLAFKIAEPRNFFLSLGNHETASVGKLQFFKETMRKYKGDEFFKLAHYLFKSFPIAYLIQKEVFVTHGGVTPEMKIDEIREIDRLEPDVEDQELIDDLIWSDPVEKDGFTNSHRGLGLLFGPDVTRKFVTANNISAVIRSHQFKELGFSEQHDGLCITIFSCPKYKGKMKNYGAYIKLDSLLNITYVPFRAVDQSKCDDYPIFPNDLKLTRNIRRTV